MSVLIPFPTKVFLCVAFILNSTLGVTNLNGNIQISLH